MLAVLALPFVEECTMFCPVVLVRLLFASPTFVRRLKGCNSIPFPFLDRLLQTIRGVNCTEQYPNYLARLGQGAAVAVVVDFVAVASATFVAAPRLASAAVVVA